MPHTVALKLQVVHGEQRSSTISVYSMAGVVESGTSKGGSKSGAKVTKRELTLVYTLPGKQCNDILWSPAGNIVVFAHFTSDCCVFEFFDIENNISLGNRKHDRGNRLAWDPSGRILASSTISALNSKSRPIADDGYVFYTFQGNMISNIKREKLFQFSWRPRPKDLLSPEEKKKIIKNLKKYEKIFIQEDLSRKQELDSAVLTERREQALKFLEYTRTRRAQYKAYKNIRVILRDGYDSDDDSLFEVSKVFEEKILSSEKEVL